MPCPSSFPGPIDGIPHIYADNFTDQNKSAYFLSHFHGDHIKNLKHPYLPVALKKNNSFIYASEETVAIVKIYVPELSDQLQVLNFGITQIPITTDGGIEMLKVIAVDAKHSWGSLIFLFQYKGHNIMYTGDFRISPNELNTGTYGHLFNNNGERVHLDKLYIDVTFERVASFPPRSVVEKRVAEIVQKWLEADENNKVEFLTSACFGYEEICNTVYNEIGIKTCIVNNSYNIEEDKDIWDIYSQFSTQFPGIMRDQDSARIHLYEYRLFQGSNSPNILSIRFFAKNWSYMDHINRKNDNYYEALYATHSAADELNNFMQKFDVNPNNIVRFVDPIN